MNDCPVCKYFKVNLRDYPCNACERNSNHEWSKFTPVEHPVEQNPYARQEGGKHYKGEGQDVAEFCISHGLGFAEGNVIKYTFRHPKKGKMEDLRKAKHYLEMIAFTKYGEIL